MHDRKRRRNLPTGIHLSLQREPPPVALAPPTRLCYNGSLLDSTQHDLDSIRRVLVTRLRWLGDVVMSTPMLEILREALPQAQIEYLTAPAFAAAIRGHPSCDRIHTLPLKPGARATLAVVRQLRSPRIDWVFDTLGNPRSAVLVALTNPRHSVAPDRGLRTRLYEHRQRHRPGERSAVRHQLDMLTPLLGRVEVRPTSLYVEEEERQAVAEQLGIERGAELALLHPGATSADRAWPVDRWPPLIAELQNLSPGIMVRVITQPGWESAAQQIVERATGDVERLPALDLRPLMALLTEASLYIGNDGGILHTAVALRVPTVGIFGPTFEDVWFPYEDWGPYRAVKRPKKEAAAPVDKVAEAVRSVGGGQ